MKLSEVIESLKQAFDSMKANKLRALLASLGVVIGISFVILMGWVLAGLDKALEDTINLIGTDMLYVDKWDWAGGKNWKDLRSRKSITLKQANALSERMKSAEYIIPVARKWGNTIKYGTDDLKGISVEGTKSEYGLTPGGTVVEGRFFNQTEERTGTKVAVLGYGIYKTLFDEKDAIGKVIKINGHKYWIIGVVKKQATLLTDFIDQVVYIPFQSFVTQFGINNRSISIAVKAGSEIGRAHV